MTVIKLNRPSQSRIIEFCQWQSQQPKFQAKEEWRKQADAAGFADIRDSDMGRVVDTLRNMAAAEYHHANLLAAERNGQRAIEIDDEDDGWDDAASDRLKKLHYEGATINDLAASLGTPEEWLEAAMIHLKLAACEQRTPKIVVSEAAVGLLLYRIEQLEHGGEPWQGNAS